MRRREKRNEHRNENRNENREIIRNESRNENREIIRNESRNINRNENRSEYEKRRTGGRVLLWVVFAEIVALVIGLVIVLVPRQNDDLDALLEQDVTIAYEEVETEKTQYVPRPDIDEQLLTVNEYSRPGTKTDGIKYIVVHYLGNPRTTAQENHDYFESLKNQDPNDENAVSMSANFVIGLDGEIIQCVPEDEIAYASNSANHESISVEDCHMDETGKFNEATYYSLVKLVAYLTEKYDLGRDDIKRHYDVTPWKKACPKYYVDHEDKWEEFKDDVMAYREECGAAAAENTEPATEQDQLAAYLASLEETETE